MRLNLSEQPKKKEHAMISVDEAMKIITSQDFDHRGETVSLWQALGRVLAENVAATRHQPPYAASAMDGYAVRIEDLASGKGLQVIGEAPAGRPFDGRCETGTAVRVFTGSVVPEGADHVVIQEDVRREDGQIFVTAPQAGGRNIRSAGVDFKSGDVLVKAGTKLNAFHLTALASANRLDVKVVKRPTVVMIANGDELRMPGDALEPSSIICSTPFGLSPLIETWGGEAQFAGIATDSRKAISERVSAFEHADILIPIGGASVGDHDHMRDVFADSGWEKVFEKVAVKPGKPTWFSKKNGKFVLGLPGNPASSLVCAHLFLKPLLYAFTGRTDGPAHVWNSARLKSDLQGNGPREGFLRGRTEVTEGELRLAPSSRQDSSLVTPFLDSDCLIRRLPNAAAAKANDELITYLKLG